MIALLLGLAAQAKDCPSKLPSHTVNLGDWGEVGAELRAMSVAMDPGDQLATDAEDGFDLAYFGGLRGFAALYPSSSVTVVLEPETRYKNPGWEDQKIPGFWPMRINQALVAYEGEALEGQVGIQGLTWGSGALLDTRAMALRGEYGNKQLQVGLFAGMSQDAMLRNGPGCLWTRYATVGGRWKKLSDSMNENKLAGLDLSLKHWKPWKVKAIYLGSFTEDPTFAQHAVAVSVAGPLVAERASLVFEPVLTWGADRDVSAGAVAQLRLSPGSDAPELHVGIGLNAVEEHPVTSVWESLSWGYLRRYSLHDGQLARLALRWKASDAIAPKIEYHLAAHSLADGPDGDELDVGAVWTINSKHTAYFGMSALDLAGPYDPSWGGFLELRLVAGS